MASSSSPTQMPSSPLRLFFILESALNIISAIPMLVAPTYIFNLITVPLNVTAAHPAARGSQPVAPQLIQFLACFIIALTVPLLYGISEPSGIAPSKSTTPASVQKPSSPSALLALARSQGNYRRRVYVMLAIGEVALSLVIITQLVNPADPPGRPGTLKPSFMLGAFLALINLAVLRAWAIVVRDRWFGGFGAALSTGAKKEQ